MTAYLQPGDRIHLAIPVTPGLPGDQAAEEAEHTRAQYEQEFHDRGVTITGVTANPALTHPVVVAVFRDELEPSPAQIVDRYIRLVTG